MPTGIGSGIAGEVFTDQIGSGSGGSTICPTRYSLNFNGSNQIGLEGGTSFALGVDNFSYSFWFKTSTIGVSGILHTDSTADRMEISLSATGLLTATWTTVTFPTTASLNDGEWHHAVLSVDRLGYWRWYIDGVNTNSADHSSLSGDPISNTGTIWGAILGTGDLLDGNLTEISIWGTALSSSEVLTIYNNMFGSQTCLTDLTFGSGNLIQNGSFNQIGPQLIDNPTFNAPTSPDLIINGDFSAESINLIDNPNFTDTGADLLTQPIDLTIDFVANSGGVIVDADTFTTAGGSYDGLRTNSTLLTVGKSYKLVISGSTTSSGFTIGSLGGNGDEYGTGFGTFYFVALHYGLWVRQQTAGTTDLTTFTIEELGADWIQSGLPDDVGTFGENGLTITSVNGDGNVNRVRQSSVTAASKSYKVTYTIHSATLTGVNKFRYWTGTIYADLPTAITGTPQTFYYTTLPTTANFAWYLKVETFNGSTTDNVTISNISVQELGEGWGLGAGWSVGDGVVTADSAGAAPISQVVNGFTAGSTYKVKFEVTAITQGYVRVYAYVGDSGAFSNIFSSPTLQTGEYEVDFVFGGTDKTLRFYGSTGSNPDFAGSITNVTVQEVDWAFEGGWSLGSNKALATAAAGGDTLYQTGVFTLDKSYKTTFLSTLDSGNCFAEFGSDGFIGQLPTGTASNLFYYQTNEVGDSARIAFDVQSIMTGSISNVLTYQMDPNGYWNIPTANSTQLVLNPTFTNTGPEEVTNGDFSGTALGSELITNGDFAVSGTLTSTSWSLGWSSGDSGLSISGGALNLVNNGGAFVGRAWATNGVDSNNGFLEIGKTYSLTYEVTENIDSATLYYYIGGYWSIAKDVGVHTVEFTTTSDIFVLRNGSLNTTIKIDNVSVKEVLQLVTNGDFTDGVEGVVGGNFESGLIGTVANSGGTVYTWALNTVVPISGTQDGLLSITSVGTNASHPRLKFDGNLSLDKSFVLTFDYKVNSGTCKFSSINRGGGGSYNFPTTQVLTGSGTYTFYFQGTGTGDITINFDGTNLFDTQFDNVSVKELGADWTVVDGTEGSVVFGDSFAEITKTGVTATYLQQDYAVTLGASHKLTYTITENTLTGGGTELGLSNTSAYPTGGITAITLDASVSATPKTVYLTVTNAAPTAALRFFSTKAGGSIKITDISVQELGEGWSVRMNDLSPTTSLKYVEFVETGARFVSDITDAPYLYLEQNTLSVGKLYKLTCSVAYTGTGGIKAYVGGQSFPLTEGVNTFYTSSLSTSTVFRFLRNNNDVDCIISNVSVEETGLDWVSPDAGTVNTFSATGLTMTSVNGAGDNTIQQVGVTADDQAYKVDYNIAGSSLTAGNYLQFYNGATYVNMKTTVGGHILHFTRSGADDSVFLKLASNDGSLTDTVDIGSITIVEVQGWTLEDGKLVGDLPDLAKSATQGIGAIAGNSYKATMDVAIAEEELVTNGSFREVGTNVVDCGDFSCAVPTDYWTFGTGWSVGDNKASCDGSTGNLIQSITGSINKSFKLVFTISDFVSGIVTPAFVGVTGTSYNANGTYTEYIESATDPRFVFYSTLFDGSITNVSVQEVGQGWTFQNDGTASSSFGENKFQFVTSGDYTNLVQLQTIDLGKTYKYSFECVDFVSGSALFQLGGATVGTTINAGGIYSGTYTSPTGDDHIQFKRNTACNLGITNVSVEEVGELKVDIGGAPVQSITTSGTHSLTFTAVDSDPFRIYGSTFTGSVTNIFVTQVAGDTLERWWRVNGNIDTLTDPTPNVASNGISNSIVWFNSPQVSSDTP